MSRYSKEIITFRKTPGIQHSKQHSSAKNRILGVFKGRYLSSVNVINARKFLTEHFVESCNISFQKQCLNKRTINQICTLATANKGVKNLLEKNPFIVIWLLNESDISVRDAAIDTLKSQTDYERETMMAELTQAIEAIDLTTVEEHLPTPQLMSAESV